MKLHLDNFICDFDEGSEMVTLICTPSLESFIIDHNINWTDFLPDFVNEKMNQFVFCTQNKEWKAFAAKIYAACQVSIVLHVIPTPDDFDIYKYFSCNHFTIEYILNPEYRQRAFLNQVSHNISSKYFIDKLYDALNNPKKSKLNSIYKLKLFLNEYCCSDHNNFTTRRRLILTKLSIMFPKTYCWIYDHYVMDNERFSDRFRADFFICNDDLLRRVDEIDLNDGFLDDTEIALPF
jgi:hypothetical protein